MREYHHVHMVGHDDPGSNLEQVKLSFGEAEAVNQNRRDLWILQPVWPGDGGIQMAVDPSELLAERRGESGGNRSGQ